MFADFPGTLAFHRSVVTHLRGLEPLVLVFGDQPADSAVRDGGYVIVDPDPGYPLYERAGRGDSERVYRVDLRVCAFSNEQLLNTVDMVRERMRGFRPLVGSRWTDVFEEVTGPAVPDESVPTDVRYSSTLTYRVDG